MQLHTTSLLAVTLAGAAHGQTLLVSSRMTDEVLTYDARTGAPLGAFVDSMLDNPVGLGFGPDGHVYVASADDDRIARFHWPSGVHLGDVASTPTIASPRDLAFGPGGTLFVGNAGTDEVLRIDPANGGVLMRYGGSGLDGPTGFTFDARGDLWIGGVLSNDLHRFDVDSGALLETRTDPLLSGPHDLALGPDGWIYVTNASGGAPRVLRFDPRPGGPIEAYAAGGALRSPLGLQWTPGGDVLVANQGRDQIRVFSGASAPTGSVLVSSGAGGLDGPLFLALNTETFGPRVVPPPPGSAGTLGTFALAGMTPGGTALGWVDVAVGSPGVFATSLCPGVRLDLARPRPFLVRPADGSGLAVAWRTLPISLSGTTLLLQGLDVSTCAVSPVVRFLP